MHISDKIGKILQEGKESELSDEELDIAIKLYKKSLQEAEPALAELKRLLGKLVIERYLRAK